MVSWKTMALTCPILHAIIVGLILAIPVSLIAGNYSREVQVSVWNITMVCMFFVVPGLGFLAKLLIRRKYMPYIPESSDWVYHFKQEIDNLGFTPKLKSVTWSELTGVIPCTYSEHQRVYALLLLIDNLRGKIPAKGVPQEARDFIDKHYPTYIGLLLH